ncbi:hypothetical protein [Kribbella solani]|uniref:hypothetical protein n=1 Tax=Kribbella solani TaxID=236067 RepID=UPI0029A25D81|nr:hypothetical protein [Kribbella solani]MDX2973675.1 hypothetical protein [Kribbella solani]
MADSDQVFVVLEGELEVAAGRVAEVLGLELVGDLRDKTGELQYKGRARSFDGVVGVYVGLNEYLPDAGETQAMDRYPVVVDVQSRVRKDAQAEEARLAFEVLTDALADIPALLSHNVEFLVAAYLSGRGVHTFEADITLDEPDRPTWEPWVVT